MKNKGFTLIELLVVIAIIGILAVIVISSLSQSRLRAQDAAIMSAVSSYRNAVELEFEGDFTNLCTSSSYSEIESYVNNQGGAIDSCTGDTSGYRIISILSTTLASLNAVAYAADEDAFCINSNGFAKKIVLNDASTLTVPYCSLSEPGAGSVGGVCAEFPPAMIQLANETNGCISGTYVDTGFVPGENEDPWIWECSGIQCSHERIYGSEVI